MITSQKVKIRLTLTSGLPLSSFINNVSNIYHPKIILSDRKNDWKSELKQRRTQLEPFDTLKKELGQNLNDIPIISAILLDQ